MINERNLILLLNIVQNKGSIKRLKREKLSFKQIIELTEQGVSGGFLTYEDDKITITELGASFLNENLSRIISSNKDEWIELDFKNKIIPFPKNEVFLPDRSEFSFLDENSI